MIVEYSPFIFRRETRCREEPCKTTRLISPHKISSVTSRDQENTIFSQHTPVVPRTKHTKTKTHKNPMRVQKRWRWMPISPGSELQSMTLSKWQTSSDSRTWLTNTVFHVGCSQAERILWVKSGDVNMQSFMQQPDILERIYVSW